VPPDFVRYKAVSRQIREIFSRHTDLIEPLSLDEAYLDVTHPKTDLPSATATAEAIRAAICEETALTASAGVAPNKFLAKIASDWNKPDGLCVIRPHQVEAFLTPLPVGRLPGVGKVMEAKLAALGIATVGELRHFALAELEQRFGRWGCRLHELARGVDEHAVQPERPTLQISAEDTFEHDLPLDELEPHIRRLAEKAWEGHLRQHGTNDRARIPRTVVLKLKTSDFHTLTRSLTPGTRFTSADALGDIASALRSRVDPSSGDRYRLVGVGLSGFIDAEDDVSQGDLFEARTAD
jgi:DNA polymerase-4